MSNDEKEILKEKIKRAIKISSQKLIEKKRALGQKLVISEDGKISVIEPEKKRAATIHISINPFKVKFQTSRQTNDDLLTIDSPEDIKCVPIINSLALKQMIIYHNMYSDSGLISVSFPRKTLNTVS
jgi:hypothetical protein